MASAARITHIKGGFAESQHGFGQNIEFTASRPRCYYLVQITIINCWCFVMCSQFIASIALSSQPSCRQQIGGKSDRDHKQNA